jgi:hypothetical protein
VRLEKDGDDVFSLIMSPMEWPEIFALAQFARDALAYDSTAAYVAQVLTYSVPLDMLGDQNIRLAFAAVDRLTAESGGDLILRLPKDHMRALLILLGMAAESEGQAEIVHDGAPEKFPHQFPDLGPSSHDYARVFDELLRALHNGLSVDVRRPPSYRD